MQPRRRATTSLAELVVEYINERLADKVRERLAWRALSSDVALARAAYGRDERGRKHPHQYRLTDTALASARSLATDRSDLIFSAQTFEALLLHAQNIKRAIHGLGPMWTYDFAERIGAHLDIGPTHTVYVQRGALQGARRLNLRVRSGRLVHAELPDALRALDAGDVEDFLCIKKSLLSAALLLEPKG